MKSLISFLLLTLMCFVASCTNKSHDVDEKENYDAKKMLQGIWIDEESLQPVWRADHDSIFYADSTSVPVAFKIVGDSILLGSGEQEVRYAIIQQTQERFSFRNQNDEEVMLVKSKDVSDAYAFTKRPPVSLNQNNRIARDTVLYVGEKRLHCYVNVNPTKYKVYVTSFNPDGVEVSNVYYDNTIHLAVYEGNRKLYGHEFKKQDFTNLVPSDFMEKAILSDLVFGKVVNGDIHYQAQFVIPDSNTSFYVAVKVSSKGEVTLDRDK